MADTLDAFVLARAAAGASAGGSMRRRPSAGDACTEQQQPGLGLGGEAGEGLLSASLSLPHAGMVYGASAGGSDALSRFMHTQRQQVFSNPVYQRPYTLDM